MCGIFGSKTPKEFLELYQLNQKRGDLSHGMFFISNDKFRLDKGTGLYQQVVPYSFDIYLGHTRASTNNVIGFDYNESHPVQFGDWVVGHNGIISNFKALKAFYNLYPSTTNLDSSIFTSLLTYFYHYNGDEPTIIKKTLELLSGIFGCWIYNLKSRNLYLVRCASSIYCKEDGTAFSSAQVEGFRELKEGIIYRINNGIEEVGTFKYDSPYYIPGE